MHFLELKKRTSKHHLMVIKVISRKICRLEPMTLLMYHSCIFFLGATWFKNNKVSLNKETCLNQLKCFQSLIDSIIWFFMKTSICVISCFAFNCNITATRFFSEKNVKFKLRLTRSSSWASRIRQIVSACNRNLNLLQMLHQCFPFYPYKIYFALSNPLS